MPPATPAPGNEPEYDLYVTNIKFNWIPGENDQDAIELRKNKQTPLPLGQSGCEWEYDARWGQVLANEPSLWVTGQGQLKVIARFELYRDDTFDAAANCTVTIGALSSLKTVFGNLVPKSVHFTNGVSDTDNSRNISNYVEFELEQGVGVVVDRSGIELTWYTHDGTTDVGGYALDDDAYSWVGMVTGAHEIYITPYEPGKPWDVGTPDDEHNPWTLALDYGIDQAGLLGAWSEPDIAGGLTQAAFAGRVYNSVGAGRGSYSSTVGSQTAYIDLQGWLTSSRLVNCYDQAFATASLANLYKPVFFACEMPRANNLVPCIEPGVTAALLPPGYGYIRDRLCGHGLVTNPFYKNLSYHDDPMAPSDWWKVSFRTPDYDRSYFSSHCWLSNGFAEWDSTVGPAFEEPLAAFLDARDTSQPWEAAVARGIGAVRAFSQLVIR